MKIPPKFEESMSWFKYEELVSDWQVLTEIPLKKQGILLKYSLEGKAAQWQKYLNTEKLKDEDNGVRYFLTEIRNRYLKGKLHIFLARYIAFNKLHRGGMDFRSWTARYNLE